METTERPVLVIGIDDSSHSFYALEWTLDHFFSPPKPSLSNSSFYRLFSVWFSENNGTEQNTGWKWVHFLSNQTEKMSQA
ncbi:hypothetical protein AAG906_034478 [Vitis piasezkii]